MFGVNLASWLKKIYAGTALPKVCLSSGFLRRNKDGKSTGKEISPVNASAYNIYFWLRYGLPNAINDY